MAARNTADETTPTEPTEGGFTLEGYAADPARLEFDQRVKALELAVGNGSFETVADEIDAAEKYRTFLANDGQPAADA